MSVADFDHLAQPAPSAEERIALALSGFYDYYDGPETPGGSTLAMMAEILEGEPWALKVARGGEAHRDRGLLAAWDGAVAAYRRLDAGPGADFALMDAYEVACNRLPLTFASPLGVARGGVE